MPLDLTDWREVLATMVEILQKQDLLPAPRNHQNVRGCSSSMTTLTVSSFLLKGTAAGAT